jgi:hypothetical protein
MRAGLRLIGLLLGGEAFGAAPTRWIGLTQQDYRDARAQEHRLRGAKAAMGLIAVWVRGREYGYPLI